MSFGLSHELKMLRDRCDKLETLVIALTARLELMELRAKPQIPVQYAGVLSKTAANPHG